MKSALCAPPPFLYWANCAPGVCLWCCGATCQLETAEYSGPICCNMVSTVAPQIQIHTSHNVFYVYLPVYLL